MVFQVPPHHVWSLGSQALKSEPAGKAYRSVRILEQDLTTTRAVEMGDALVNGATSPLVRCRGRDGSDQGRQGQKLSDGVYHIRRAGVS